MAIRLEGLKHYAHHLCISFVVILKRLLIHLIHL